MWCDIWLFAFMAFCIAVKADGDELEEMLVWSPKAKILKRAQPTDGGGVPGTNET